MLILISPSFSISGRLCIVIVVFLGIFYIYLQTANVQCHVVILNISRSCTHIVTAANFWTRYDHIESCVAVHLQRVNYPVNTRLLPVNARLLITCDTAFYAIMSVNMRNDSVLEFIKHV